MKKLLIAALALVAGIALFRLGKNLYQAPGFVLGAKAPDFSATLLDGSTAKLSDLRGKVVLVQFWASWCGPCRRENPELAVLFQKFGPKGFEIFSIGVERSEAAWRAAIARDGAVWKHHTVEISEDLKFFKGPIIDLYKVHSIPQTYLLDATGTIIGVNLQPVEIERLLAARLPK